jgi:hypothetical protein
MYGGISELRKRFGRCGQDNVSHLCEILGFHGGDDFDDVLLG